jgi:hypothetical protein
MRYLGWVATAVIVGSSGFGSVAAQGQDARWLGTKVVTKYESPLRVGGQVVDDGAEFRVYNVERADSRRLYGTQPHRA